MNETTRTQAQKAVIHKIMDEADMTTAEIIYHELLEKYTTRRDPEPFIQYEAVLGENADDDEYYSSSTFELMCEAELQVFINPTTKPEDAIRALRGIADRIERDGLEYDRNTASNIVASRRSAQAWAAQSHEEDDLFD